MLYRRWLTLLLFLLLPLAILGCKSKESSMAAMVADASRLAVNEHFVQTGRFPTEQELSARTHAIEMFPSTWRTRCIVLPPADGLPRFKVVVQSADTVLYEWPDTISADNLRESRARHR